MPVGNEALDYLYHVVDVVRRSRVVVGAQDAQSIHLLVKALDVVLRQLAYAPVVSLGHLNDAVFDVSEVLHVMDLVIPVFQVAAQHVKYDVRKGVTYVARAVQVGAAYVHGHLLPQVERNRAFRRRGCRTASSVRLNGGDGQCPNAFATAWKPQTVGGGALYIHL